VRNAPSRQTEGETNVKSVKTRSRSPHDRGTRDRQDGRTLIGSLRDEGKTILLTTHYMEEAQRLADRVTVLAGGRIVASGPPEELAGSSHADAEIAVQPPSGVAAGELPPVSAVEFGELGTPGEHDCDSSNTFPACSFGAPPT
jgi:hypothetical protein